jgi:hypothetical protein
MTMHTLQTQYSSMNQKQRLLCYLKEHKTINPLIAWTVLGIYRLSDAIFKLRNDGHAINTNHLVVKNHFNEPCVVAEYSLQEA